MSPDMACLPSERAPLHMVSNCGCKIKVGVVQRNKIFCVDGPSKRFYIIASHFDLPIRYLVLLENLVGRDNNAISLYRIYYEGNFDPREALEQR